MNVVTRNFFVPEELNINSKIITTENFADDDRISQAASVAENNKVQSF